MDKVDEGAMAASPGHSFLRSASKGRMPVLVALRLERLGSLLMYCCSLVGSTSVSVGCLAYASVSLR